MEAVRPDLAPYIFEAEGIEPASSNPLADLTIGEVGVVYEALRALDDHSARKQNGLYFTPDDVADFMARLGTNFEPGGIWLDPCCGVGNLSWHLIANSNENNRHEFIANRLYLVDVDGTALRTAVILLSVSFSAPGQTDAYDSLRSHAFKRDFLEPSALPQIDYCIANPPYAATSARSEFQTVAARDQYAYFFERIMSKSKGFVIVTPASFLSASKFSVLRDLLLRRSGGSVYVFDNVPDTCFRGFKYGSQNTSKTNFVRAAITISAPGNQGWQITPILRWSVRSRARMFDQASNFLVPLALSPNGGWAKLMPGTEQVWDRLAEDATFTTIEDLITTEESEWTLEIAATPRYYISASTQSLDRASKHVLRFPTKQQRDQAYLVLNSSLPYWWWRTTDGGISLSRRTLLTTPVPRFSLTEALALLKALEESDYKDRVYKLNAGRRNENVRRPLILVEALDSLLLTDLQYDFSQVYKSDMFNDI